MEVCPVVKIVKLDLYDKILRLNFAKNLVGPDGQGKSQSQDFIDEFHGQGRTLFRL